MTQSKKVSRRDYTTEEIDRILAAVILHDGNVRRAVRVLKGQGLDVPRETVRGWVTSRSERYAQLRDKLLPEIHGRVAEEHTELARANIDGERLALARTIAELDNIPARDLSTVSRNMAVGSGIHTQRAMELRGLSQPTVAVQVNIGDQIRGIAAKGYKLSDDEGQPLTADEAVAKYEALCQPSESEQVPKPEPEDYLPKRPPPEVKPAPPEVKPPEPAKEKDDDDVLKQYRAQLDRPQTARAGRDY
jgi:hypothetical protein